MINIKPMRESTLVLGLFILFMILRVVAWSQTVLFEDHDSVGYLTAAQAFREFNFEVIWQWYPDLNPAYPIATSLLSFIFGDIEFSARLCSLLFSILLFYSVYKLIRLYFNEIVASIVLLFVSINPVLIKLSFSILTEPMYISICITGLYLFLKQADVANQKYAILLGMLFGISFIARTEGIIFLLVIPFFQSLHFVLIKTRTYNWSRLINWSVIYMLFYCITIAPQIIAVSTKTGEPTLNGRQVWSKILKSSPEKTYAEKIYGIDYDPGKINLAYLQENPDKIDESIEPASFNVTLYHMYHNAGIFLRYELRELLSWFQIFLLPFGIVAIYSQRNNYRKLYCGIILIGYAAASMVPPLWHNVATRHIAIITPVLLILVALGIVQITDLIKKKSLITTFDRKTWAILFSLVLVVAQSKDIRPVLAKQPVQNKEYNHEEMQEIARVVRSHIDDTDSKSLVISARKEFIGYFSGMKRVALPYADWNQMKRYWKLNGVHFVLIRRKLLKQHPIFQNEEYLSSNDEDFKLIWTKEDVYGEPIYLYQAN